MSQRIIAGYRDRPGGRDALALGVALADLDERTELTVTSAYLYNPPVASGPPKGWRKDLRDRADAELEPARAALAGRPRTTVRTCCGVSPADGLHRLAEELRADTLVVGVSHHHGLDRIRVGSVTEQTIHGAPCAVAVAPVDFAERTQGRIRRVSVAYNGSDESRRALSSAAEIARAADARLTILGALEDGAVWYSAYVGPDDARAMRALVRDGLAEAAASVHDVGEVRVRILDAHPGRSIAAAVADEDLLVLGSRGYGPVRRALLGSVSSHLVRHAVCPMLVVPRGAALHPGSPAPAPRLGEAAV